MRKMLLPLFAFLLISLFSWSQGNSTAANKDKYRINLPESWGKSYRYIKILSDVLPEKVDELKDKEICGDDCNPFYRVALYISQPNMEEFRYSKIPSPVNTNTRAGMLPLVLGPDGRVISTNLALAAQNTITNADNKWQFRSFYTFSCYLVLMDTSNKVLSKMMLVDPEDWWEKKMSADLNRATYTTPAIYLDANYDKLMPDVNDIYAIIQNKILELKPRN